ncbi:hypothetical protein NC651_012128 [Populus alba x Populus x berolinensis]|nr:hypothetical protein NC651_012128 [Populus alba x Populus x berolinensis]
MKTFFDIRVPDAMITGYSKRSLLEKAEAFVKKIAESEMKLDADSFDRLATGYHVGDQMVNSSTVKKEISTSIPGWELKTNALALRIEGLRGRGDVEAAKELFKLVMERCRFEPAINDKSKSQLY